MTSTSQSDLKQRLIWNSKVNDEHKHSEKKCDENDYDNDHWRLEASLGC